MSRAHLTSGLVEVGGDIRAGLARDHRRFTITILIHLDSPEASSAPASDGGFNNDNANSDMSPTLTTTTTRPNASYGENLRVRSSFSPAGPIPNYERGI
jgi:hypothetical protein